MTESKADLGRTFLNAFPVTYKGKMTMCVIDKDNNTLKKNIQFIEDPDVEFYSSLPEYYEEHSKEKPTFFPIEQVEKHTVRYSRLFAEILNIIRQKDIDSKGKTTRRAVEYITRFNNATVNNNPYDFGVLFSHPYIHNCDFDISDYFAKRWKKLNPDYINTGFLSKAYFDIESDVINHIGFPDESIAPCKTTAISYFYNGKMYAFFSTDTERVCKSMHDFIATKQEKFIEKMETKHGIDDLTVKFFDSEMELYRYFFNKVNNEDQPDVLCAWNLSYDFRTCMNRIRRLGSDPSKIMSSNEFVEKGLENAYYFFDEKSKDFGTKRDYAIAATPVQYVDQMINFAKLRVTMGKRESFSLDNILREELKVTKIDLGESSIKTIMYDDFEKFAEYSIVDTFRLHQLEEKNKDLNTLYEIMMVTSTRLNKVMTKTISLRNYTDDFAETKDHILTNNPNKNHLHRKRKTDEDEDTSFKGALVANPLLNDYFGLDNLRLVHDNVVDLDAAALYPNVAMSGNMSRDTLIFKIAEDNASDFMETMSSRDYIAIGKRWLDLPSLAEWEKEIA